MKQKTVFTISGMHCTSCAMNIDFELEDVDGITEAKTHYAKQISEVTFDQNKVNEEQIITVIKKLGYDTIVA